MDETGAGTLLDLLNQIVSHTPIMFVCTNNTGDQHVRVSAAKTQEILTTLQTARATNPSVTLESVVSDALHSGTLTAADMSAPESFDGIHCYLKSVFMLRW